METENGDWNRMTAVTLRKNLAYSYTRPTGRRKLAVACCTRVRAQTGTDSAQPELGDTTAMRFPVPIRGYSNRQRNLFL
jgi:hypothetical protein